MNNSMTCIVKCVDPMIFIFLLILNQSHMSIGNFPILWLFDAFSQQREQTVLDRRDTYIKGHNHRDLNRLRYLSPGMGVNTRYINSTKGVSYYVFSVTTFLPPTVDLPVTWHAGKNKVQKHHSGFFFACEGLGRIFDHSFSACAFFVLFFVLMEISSRALIPLFKPGSVHSGSVSWDDCGQTFPDKLRVSSFPDTSSHYAWTAA